MLRRALPVPGTDEGGPGAVPEDSPPTLGYCLPPHSTSRLLSHIKHLLNENL